METTPKGEVGWRKKTPDPYEAGVLPSGVQNFSEVALLSYQLSSSKDQRNL
jgi:hypothetical protein